MKLLQSQKNEIFDLIEEFELSPSQFEFYDTVSKRVKNEKTTKLFYKKTDFYFAFETSQNSTTEHYSIFSPGENSYRETFYPSSWNNQLNTFKKWLSYLIREINAPNKWDRLSHEIGSLGISFDEDNDKFSVQEFEELKSKIIYLKQQLNTIPLLPEQLHAINNKLDFLTESAKTMNKFDWKSLFIGIFVSVIIQLQVTPENAEAIWTTIKTTFNKYILI